MMNALSSPNIDQKCSHIIKGLYLGSLKVAVSEDVLQRKGITHILQVIDDFQPLHPKIFTYKTISIKDNTS